MNEKDEPIIDENSNIHYCYNCDTEAVGYVDWTTNSGVPKRTYMCTTCSYAFEFGQSIPKNNFVENKMDDITAEKIRQKVQDSFSYSIGDIFTITQIIDESNLTEDEKEWAKEHIDWQIVILP